MAHDSVGGKNQPQYSSAGVPASAADLSEVANWAAYNGNRKSDTESVRSGLTGADVWDGLEFYTTDTKKLWTYVVGTGWVLMFQIPTAWTNLTLTSGWTATGGVWAPPAYRLNQLGEVEIRGQMIPRAGYTTSEVFATLPSGARPAQQIEFPAVNNGGASPALAGVVVTTGGAMTLTPAGTSNINFGYVHLATV